MSHLSRLLHVLLVVLVVPVIGCGDDGGSVTPDAAVTIDAPTSSVTEVTCPSAPDATVITTDNLNRYQPQMTTITAGQVVEFQTSLEHDVAPLPPMTDPNLVVGFNKTVCLRFDAAGTFQFKCVPHGFTGTITVN